MEYTTIETYTSIVKQIKNHYSSNKKRKLLQKGKIYPIPCTLELMILNK